jgi:hypothetical protein
LGVKFDFNVQNDSVTLGSTIVIQTDSQWTLPDSVLETIADQFVDIFAAQNPDTGTWGHDSIYVAERREILPS